MGTWAPSPDNDELCVRSTHNSSDWKQYLTSMFFCHFRILLYRNVSPWYTVKRGIETRGIFTVNKCKKYCLLHGTISTLSNYANATQFVHLLFLWPSFLGSLHCNSQYTASVNKETDTQISAASSQCVHQWLQSFGKAVLCHWALLASVFAGLSYVANKAL